MTRINPLPAVPGDKKEAIEQAVADLKEAHKTEDMAKIDSASEALNNAWQAASQDIYAAQQQASSDAGQDTAAGENGASDEKDQEDVTDVEFEEVDDSK